MKKKPTMTREQATALYEDLHKAMSQAMAKKGRNLEEELAKIKGESAGAARMAGLSGVAGIGAMPKRIVRRPATAGRGQAAAVAFVLLFAAGKVVVSGLEAGGVLTVQQARASIQTRSSASTLEGFSRDDIRILTALDARRAELEKRSKDLEERRAELDRRDSEFTIRLAQLKDLTSRMKSDREKDEKKRGDQLEQLANVYGSMNPPEAALLIEQLDVSIALELIQKMPEKRIGQILALMSPERALAITKLLSGKKD